MKRLSMAAALFLIASMVHAEDAAEAESRFRVGAAAAFSDYKGDPSFPIEDNGLGVQIYAQALLNSWLAAEIGYFNSGGFERDIDPGQSDGPVETRLGGFNISALAYLPLFQDAEADIDIFVRVGLYDYDIDLTTVVGNSKVPGSLGHSTGVLGGAGFVFNISEDFGIRAVFDWYDINNADLWSVGLGLEYKF